MTDRMLERILKARVYDVVRETPLDRAAQLLGDLADQAVLGRLTRLDLAPGELPATGQLRRRRAARGQHLPRPHDGGTHDDVHDGRG